MTTTDTTPQTHLHPVVAQQVRLDRRRHWLRDGLLRPLGLGLLVKPHIEGRDYIPASGPTIVIMNHIGAIDPFVVVAAMRTRYLVPMTKEENYYHPIIGLIARAWGVYPVRRGEVDRQALDSTVALLQQGYAVLIAPEGTRGTALAEAHDGTAYVATKADPLILPVGLEGTDAFPSAYKRLQRPQVTIRFGQPFRFRIEGRRRIPRDELRQMTREMMYQIAQLIPAQRRGVYSDLDQMTTEFVEFVS